MLEVPAARLAAPFQATPVLSIQTAVWDEPVQSAPPFTPTTKDISPDALEMLIEGEVENPLEVTIFRSGVVWLTPETENAPNITVTEFDQWHVNDLLPE